MRPLLRDFTLVTLALGLALGWALFQVASGLGDLVSTLLVDFEDVGGSRFGEPLTWEVGGRILTLGPLLRGLVELAVVLLVASWVYGRSRALEVDAGPQTGVPGGFRRDWR